MRYFVEDKLVPFLEQLPVSTEAAIFLFRNRAEAFKAIRERTIDPGARRLLEDIVIDYQGLIEVLVRIQKAQNVVAKRIDF